MNKNDSIYQTIAEASNSLKIKLIKQLGNDDKNQIIELYKQILKREPDKTGLYYFTSKLKSNTLTIPQISKILKESEEGKIKTKTE